MKKMPCNGADQLYFHCFQQIKLIDPTPPPLSECEIVSFVRGNVVCGCPWEKNKAALIEGTSFYALDKISV